MRKPNLYIIAGCNGAGKTTNSFTVLPKMLDCKEFVNADSIALGLSPFQPENVAIAAGKIMLNRINELIGLQNDFAFETTLSTRSFVKTIEKAKQNNFEVSIIFYYLDDVELAIQRVQQRVLEGGHNIPENVIRPRYVAGIYNLIHLYLNIGDAIVIVDNSTKTELIVAVKSINNQIEIRDKTTWTKILNQSKNE